MRATENPLPDPFTGPAPRSVPAGVLAGGSTWSSLDRNGRGCVFHDGLLLTAWAADPCGDPGSAAIHLRDRATGRWWTIGEVTPSRSDSASEPVLWSSPGSLRLAQSFDAIDVVVEIWVDSDRDAEIRRLTLTNRTERARSIEATTFVETVLHAPAAHASHPTFSKLFVQTEYVAGDAAQHGHGGALLARRRPRGEGEHFPTIVHALIGAAVTEYESDRARWFGRGRSRRAPTAMTTRDALSATVGNVLDPALCLRADVELQPGASARFVWVLAAATDRTHALDVVHDLARAGAIDASLQRARDQEPDRRAAAALEDGEAEHLQSIWVAMSKGDPRLRAPSDLRARAGGDLGDLHRLGIADPAWTMVVDFTNDPAPDALARARRAHRYAMACGLPLESVWIVPSSDEELRREAADTKGLHVLTSRNTDASVLDLVRAVAGAYVRDARFDAAVTSVPPLRASSRAEATVSGDRTTTIDASSASTLRFAHEHGGFAADGRSYVVHLRRRDDGSWTRPPRPWVNLVANEHFGSIVSESGSITTWSRNSREHRLTPWMNDPVLDPHVESFYLQDAVDRRFWSPLPGPAPDGEHYEMEHGFGYSVCRHRSEGIEQTTTLFVPLDAPVQIVRVHLRNLTARRRTLALVDHRRLVLGPETITGGRTVQTAIEAGRRVLLARNPLAGPFADGLAFAHAVTAIRSTHWSATTDREEFLGPMGDVEAPAHLLAGGALSGRCGADLDAAFTQRVEFELGAGAEATIHLLFGEVTSEAQLASLLARFDRSEAIEEALQAVHEFWRTRLGAIEVSTPSAGIDLLLNGWAAYQTVVCRLWARSAFYQSGGAFGFRDQLQDAVAMVGLWPELARQQIVLHASHQFVEGDVLHWWHPPLARGLRTRFADDLLWLPHLTAHYLRVTGDHAVLDEPAPFLRARALEEGEDEAFLQPEPAGVTASVFEHACRAIDRSLAVGEHGLPLFGTGDWNDGMNRVGREGRGESVWMGFFLHTVLGEWIPWCEARGESARAERYRAHRARLGRALQDGGWDGHWFRRGYYDDGSPLGSSQSDECRIDALVQAWSVISGAVPEPRAREAMDALAAHLVDEDAGIVRLLAPPFVDTPHDPGYIKGYVAGVRENGGQYTHAALWVVRAFAELGDHARAARLLELIGPVNHTRSDEAVERYQVEPYVVAADIYGVAPHVGRGGWTWYTGSAGWMVRVGIETVLGIAVHEGRWLVICPRIPDQWPGFRVRYRPFGGVTTYEIEVVNPDAAAQHVVAVRLDGTSVHPTAGAARLDLAHDGRVHHVEVVLGRAAIAGPRMRAAEWENR